MEDLCGDLAAETEKVETAETRKAFRTASRNLIASQKEFIEAASNVDTPAEAEEAFDEYVALSEEIVALNEESVFGSADRVAQLEVELKAAETSLEQHEAGVEAGVPPECPGMTEDVFLFAFVARANAGCFDLGAELARLGRRTQAEGRKEIAEMLELFAGVAMSLVSMLQAAVPAQLDEPAVDRMIGFYEDQARALVEANKALLRSDEGAAKRAMARQSAARIKADRIAAALRLTECVNFIEGDIE